MAEPLAFHLVFGTYGSWLPNDPRGSRSAEVWADHLRPFGPATLTDATHSVAGVPHDRALRVAAQQALLLPPVVFDGLQALSVGCGFRKQVATSGFVIYACAILPCHVHLVIARHRYSIAQVQRLLKQAATARLLADGRHPFAEWRDENNQVPTVWPGEKGGMSVWTPRRKWCRRSPTWKKTRSRRGNPISAGPL